MIRILCREGYYLTTKAWLAVYIAIFSVILGDRVIEN
jgi:hypothetical protein